MGKEEGRSGGRVGKIGKVLNEEGIGKGVE